MLKTNYENIKRIASATQKGFWRVQAIAKLDQEIKNGKPQYEYLKSLISLHPLNKKSKNNFGLQITPFLQNTKIKQINQTKKLKNIPSFFVTEISPRLNYKNINGKIFQNEDEMMIYNQMPFFFLPIKKIRPRTATEKFYNSRKIEKEFNEKYELIQLYKNSFQYIQSSDMDNSHFSNSNNKKSEEDIFPFIKNNKNLSSIESTENNKYNRNKIWINKGTNTNINNLFTSENNTKTNSHIHSISQYHTSGSNEYKGKKAKFFQGN